MPLRAGRRRRSLRLQKASDSCQSVANSGCIGQAPLLGLKGGYLIRLNYGFYKLIVLKSQIFFLLTGLIELCALLAIAPQRVAVGSVCRRVAFECSMIAGKRVEQTQLVCLIGQQGILVLGVDIYE